MHPVPVVSATVYYTTLNINTPANPPSGSMCDWVANIEYLFYNRNMNISLQEITQNKLVVLAFPRYRVRDIFALMAGSAQRSPIRVIDGGNLFNVLTLNRAIRRKNNRVEEVLGRIYISRAFTCFQMEAMLHNLSDYRCPIFILDLLYTFYDESVDDGQSRRLMTDAIRHLTQASASVPVLVCIFPPAKADKRPFLMQMLLGAANSVWQPEAQPAAPQQPGLWE